LRVRAPRLSGALLLLFLALGGCKPSDQVTGSADPPASFGALAKTVSGCPPLTGTYAWPPVEGAPQGFDDGGIPAVAKHPDFFGIRSQWEGTLHIELSPDKGKRSLRIESLPGRVIWKRYLEEHYRCKGRWLEIAPFEHPSLELHQEHGLPVYLEVKLAALANGDLAIGQALRRDGGKRSLFPWGDSGSRGAWIPEADTVQWFWSRYRRISP